MDPNIVQPIQPVTPETQTPVTQPIQSTPNPPSGKTKYILIALLILLILVVVGGAYYLGASRQESAPSKNNSATTTTITPTATPIPTAPPTPTLTNDPTANWKTYSSPDNAYSFKYPDDINWKLTVTTGANFVSPDVQCSIIACPLPYNVFDFSGGISNVKSIDEYIQAFNTTNPAVSSHATPYIQDYQKIKISGLDAVETLVQTGKLAGSGPIVTVFVVSKGQGYSFGYTYTDVKLNTATKFSQLPTPNPDFISTLKFTN